MIRVTITEQIFSIETRKPIKHCIMQNFGNYGTRELYVEGHGRRNDIIDFSCVKPKLNFLEVSSKEFGEHILKINSKAFSKNIGEEKKFYESPKIEVEKNVL